MRVVVLRAGKISERPEFSGRIAVFLSVFYRLNPFFLTAAYPNRIISIEASIQLPLPRGVASD